RAAGGLIRSRSCLERRTGLLAARAQPREVERYRNAGPSTRGWRKRFQRHPSAAGRRAASARTGRQPTLVPILFPSVIAMQPGLVIAIQRKIFIVFRTVLDLIPGQRGLHGGISPVDTVHPVRGKQYLFTARPPV